MPRGSEVKVVYCENDECRVLLYEPLTEMTTMELKDGSSVGVVGEVNNNCPGCGRLGRTKGK
jgi:predicted NUDIX family phosphoesterase